MSQQNALRGARQWVGVLGAGLSVWIGYAGFASAATIGVGEASAVPGQAAVAVPLSLSVGVGESVAALSVDLQFDPLLLNLQSVTLNPTVSALGKQAQTHLVSAGRVRLILYGLDRQTLSAGQLGQLVVNVASAAPAGQAALLLQNASAAAPDGGEFVLARQDGRVFIDAPTTPPEEDLIGPVLKLTTPRENDVFKQGDPVTVSGTVSDNKPEPITVKVNGQAAAVGANGVFQMALTGLQPGKQLIYIQVWDAAGHMEDKERNVVIEAVEQQPEPPTDTVGPVLKLATPRENDKFALGAPITVAGTATDDRPGALELKINGQAYPVGANGAFSATLTGLPAGTQDIYLELRDAAGNFEDKLRHVIVQAAAAPVVKAATEASVSSNGWITSGTERYAWSQPQWLEYRIDFGAGGTWDLALTARNQKNDSAPGLPAGFEFQIGVLIDGAGKGTFGVPGSTTTYQTGKLRVSAPPGVHTVRFTWTNDVWVAGRYDANIRVQQVSFTPQ